MKFNTLLYSTVGRVATITLNRPQRLNAITLGMPREIAAAVKEANADNSVHVIVITGAGKSFCSGYDLKQFAEDDSVSVGSQPADQPWDPLADYYAMFQNTQDFMSLWRSHKPTICKVNGDAVAGGSDIALCCDFVVMTEQGRIGYPPARVWGCPTTAMWSFRLGAEQAKRMLFTGDLIDGKEAKNIGLVLDAVDKEVLDDRVTQLVDRIKGVPRNQLMMQKIMINQVMVQQGLQQTQTLATIFDGITRHSPEGVWFKEYSEKHGFMNAVHARDSGDPIAEGVSKDFVPFEPSK
eukprot:CFRG5761T1